jgi:hypothetical protein
MDQYPVLKGPQFDHDKSFQDPSVPKYHLAFWVGAGSAGMEIVAPNDMSAVAVALFTATQHYPRVTGISIYERTGPGPDDLGRVVCFAPLMQFLSKAATIIGTVTGNPISVPHSVIQTPGAGFQELQGRVKQQPGMPSIAPTPVPQGKAVPVHPLPGPTKEQP